MTEQMASKYYKCFDHTQMKGVPGQLIIFKLPYKGEKGEKVVNWVRVNG